jgi:hypothetical protein
MDAPTPLDKDRLGRGRSSARATVRRARRPIVDNPWSGRARLVRLLARRTIMTLASKTLAFSLLSLSCALTTSRALRAEARESESAPPGASSKDDFSFGFDVHRFQDDFGSGLLVATPNFWQRMRVSARGGVAWYPRALDSNGTSTWTAFYYGALVFELGPPSFALSTASVVRPYGFGGVLLVGLPDSLSSQRLNWGTIGGFGLEVKFVGPRGEGPVTYFFEVGGIGNGAKADKLPSREVVVNGFLAEAGLRFYL